MTHPEEMSKVITEKEKKMPTKIGDTCNNCGGKIGVVDDCLRCTSCESLPTKKDPYE